MYSIAGANGPNACVEAAAAGLFRLELMLVSPASHRRRWNSTLPPNFRSGNVPPPRATRLGSGRARAEFARRNRLPKLAIRNPRAIFDDFPGPLPLGLSPIRLIQRRTVSCFSSVYCLGLRKLNCGAAAADFSEMVHSQVPRCSSMKRGVWGYPRHGRGARTRAPTLARSSARTENQRSPCSLARSHRFLGVGLGASTRGQPRYSWGAIDCGDSNRDCRVRADLAARQRPRGRPKRACG